MRALPAATTLDVIRGVEGEAARGYFAALNRLVRRDLRERFAVDGRSRRPPRDRMNALLSFLYAMWMLSPFQERKQEMLMHPLLAESVPLGLVPLVQARLLARQLRGEAGEYVPFTMH